MITLGVDLGSRTTKAVLLDGGGFLARRIVKTGWAPADAAEEARAAVTADAGLTVDEVDAVVATGYGRVTVPFPAKMITEITCHAAGAASVLPEARTVIDVGGQDSKVIRIDKFGLVTDFAMNDRCAAGTGRFLEFMAQSLEVPIGEFSVLGAEGEHPADLSSICTVFAESEVLSLVAEGADVPDIVAGIHRAIARRIVTLAESVGLVPPVAMTGGGALNAGLRHHLATLLRTDILLPPHPQTMGAEGAALLAARAE
jgi:predicted CoA-substrate-specific enzyme activase